MSHKLIAYAMDCASFILQQMRDDAKYVKSIIVFGSVARHEAVEDSDIDLYIDVIKNNLEEKIMAAKKKFLGSQIVESYWKLLNVENEINIQVGDLNKDSILRESIISNGIIIFGKYYTDEEKEKSILFTIHSRKKTSENLRLWRKLYGYSQKVGRKIYAKKGILEDCHGQKIAKGVFILPSNFANEMHNLLKKMKVPHELRIIWVMSSKQQLTN